MVEDRQSVRGMVEGGYVKTVGKPWLRPPDMLDIAHLGDPGHIRLTSDAEGREASSALEEVAHWTWYERGHS